ncbi:MAG: hypothetical protein ACRC0X_06925, partial [Brevinema sp.]
YPYIYPKDIIITDNIVVYSNILAVFYQDIPIIYTNKYGLQFVNYKQLVIDTNKFFASPYINNKFKERFYIVLNNIDQLNIFEIINRMLSLSDYDYYDMDQVSDIDKTIIYVGHLYSTPYLIASNFRLISELLGLDDDFYMEYYKIWDDPLRKDLHELTQYIFSTNLKTIALNNMLPPSYVDIITNISN